MLECIHKYFLSLLALSAVMLLWSGCSELPGGGGGITPDPTFIEGTFTSSPKTGTASQDYVVKTIVFNKNGTFRAYRTPQAFSEQSPDISGTYEIIDKDIVFKNLEGSELAYRGMMTDTSYTKFEWEGMFPGDVFTKK